MSFCRKVSATFTTDGSGNATVYTDAVNGRILSVIYTYGDAATGADITISTETTAQTVLTVTNAGTASTQWQPRLDQHDNVAAAQGYTEAWAVDERVKVVVAQGGDTKTGTITVIVG